MFFVIPTIILIIIGIILIFSAWKNWNSFQKNLKDEKQYIRLMKLNSNIVLFDEILIMSAKMAILTQDPQWEKRYFMYNPQLEAAINELIKISPNIEIQQAINQIKFSNTKMADFEMGIL